MEDDKKLNKFIEGELVQLSPLEKRSIELKAEAEAVVINDKDDLKEAKKVKKALVSHRTSVKDMRLTFTRKLDNMKDQFIKKQDEVLEASIAGEAIVKEKIDEFEKEQKRLKELEEARIQSIIDKFEMPKLDRKVATKDDVVRARAAIKMELGLLDIKDRNKVVVKNQVASIRESLDELEQFITDRDEQARIAEEQRIEQEKLDAARKKLEDEQKEFEKSKATIEDLSQTISEAVDTTDPLNSRDFIVAKGFEDGRHKQLEPVVIPDYEHEQIHVESMDVTWTIIIHGKAMANITHEDRNKIAIAIIEGQTGGAL